MRTSHSVTRAIVAVAAGAAILTCTLTAVAKTSPTKAPSASTFCTDLPAASKKAATALTARVNALLAQVKAHDTKLVANRTAADAAIGQKRSAWQTDRQTVYAKLLAQAKTDAQKQAVAAFKTTMEAAATARETSVDQARITFRAGVDQVVASHASAVNTVLATYQSALQTAANQAQTSCAATTTASIATSTSMITVSAIRTQYQAAVKAARTARQTDMQALSKIGADIQKLVEIRNGSIQQALSDFQTAQHAALATLKTAFGEKEIAARLMSTTTSATATSTTAATTTTR